MKRIIHQTILAALGWSLLAFSQAQRPAARPQEQVTFKVESKLVVIDAIVRDKKGNLVDDLKQKDFRIYEDNIVQEIVTFSLENIPADAPETPAEPAAETSRAATVNFSITPRAEVKKEVLKDKRLIIMLFDLSSLKTEELIRSVTTAEEFVQKKSTPHDLLAIATYSSQLQLLQDLTNDKETLVKVLKQINPDEAGDAAAEELGEADAEAFVPDDVQFNIFNTDRRLSALETLAKTYREFQERKSLIYFSSGMTTTGIENQSQIRYTVDIANQSNMSIYTVDSRGLEALPPGGGASRGSPGGRGLFSGDALTRQTVSLSSSQETLTTLSRDTGGATFQDTNELAPVFDKVRSDTQTYYILGYYSSNSKEDGKFRKVRLEVGVPDLKLQHRPGYFASKHFTRLTQTERDRQLEEALNLERPFSELPFILQADYFKGNEKNNVVPISLQLAGDAVQFEEKGDRRQAQFEFLAQLTDLKGKVAGIARDTVEVRLPISRAEKIKSGQIMYSTGFQLHPGEYHLKFLVRDNLTGKLGSFEQPLLVPSLEGKNLQISSVVLGSRLVKPEDNSSDVRHRGLGERFRALGVARDPLMIDDKKIVPSIGHVFLGRQTLHVYFQVYGAAADRQTGRPSVESRLLFLNNKTKVRESEPYLVQQWATGDKGNVTVAMTLPLKGLQRGTYALQLHVRDNTSDTNLFQRVALVIN